MADYNNAGVLDSVLLDLGLTDGVQKMPEGCLPCENGCAISYAIEQVTLHHSQPIVIFSPKIFNINQLYRPPNPCICILGRGAAEILACQPVLHSNRVCIASTTDSSIYRRQLRDTG
jgi:hypothetical protein